MSASFSAGWRQVGICLILLAAVGMIAMTYSIIAVPLAKEFKPSRMVLMLAMTIMAGATAVISPACGNLMDRVPLRRIMVLGAAMLALGFLALSFATSFLQVLIVYGVFMAPANVLIGPMAATVLLSRWFVKMRGRALGLAITGIAAGGFVFPPVIQALLDAFAWREALRLLALLLAVLTIPAALAVINRPSDRGLHPDGAAEEPEQARAGAAQQSLSARAILSDPTFWLIGVIFAIVLAAMKGMITNLAPLAIDEGIDPSLAAYLISIYAAGGVVAKLVFAVVADTINPRLLILGSLAGVAIAMACFVGAEMGYWILALGVAMSAFFGGFIIPLQSFLVPRIFGQAIVGRVSGLLNMLMLLFLLSSPPLFGRIFDVFGNYDAIFMIFTGLLITSMLFVPYIRTHPRDDPGGGRAAPAATPAE